LIQFNRFQNSLVPGTYLYASEQESVNIRQNFPNFREEGTAFYAYGADANRGVDFYRFQNTLIPGTYLFVGEGERQNILANFPQFREEGVAFEVAI
jgi:peptidyl-prolyl cis-trans isomerase A (cyclophilin A)